MKRGRLVLVVGPSGSGKNTLISAVREAYPDLVTPVSATTRSPRDGEIEGVHYYFLSEEVFLKKVEEDAFLEWAHYGGHRYGTLRSEVEPYIANGQALLSDIEVQGARQIRSRLSKDELSVVYIDGGSWETLARRITSRGPMTPEDLEKRRLRYEEEIDFKKEADVVVENKDGALEEAKAALIALVGRLRD